MRWASMHPRCPIISWICWEPIGIIYGNTLRTKKLQKIQHAPQKKSTFWVQLPLFPPSPTSLMCMVMNCPPCYNSGHGVLQSTSSCEWVIVWTNIIIIVRGRRSVSKGKQLALHIRQPWDLVLPPFSPGHPIPLRPSFFPTGEWWTGYLGGVGFCGFLLFPSSFHFVLIKFTMSSPTCSKSDLTLS